ncbi:hypothetical protein Fmac_027929 [Flemingia macrophylla]|uniref:Uncharacterized protein n=1 Tax=Flemingia macrophylla TaxID=520843 RepID=A0ABD1LJ50_9FABA
MCCADNTSLPNAKANKCTQKPFPNLNLDLVETIFVAVMLQQEQHNPPFSFSLISA